MENAVICFFVLALAVAEFLIVFFLKRKVKKLLKSE